VFGVVGVDESARYCDSLVLCVAASIHTTTTTATQADAG
jgi:hypothetical protein